MGAGTTLIFLVTLLAIIRKWFHFQAKVRSIRQHPGLRTLFSVDSPLAGFIPPIPYISAAGTAFRNKYRLFAHYGVDIISAVSILPLNITIFVSDPEAINEIVGSRARFPKPVHRYKPLSLYGENIIASEYEEWKKYRKLSAPAFSEQNNKLVWQETVNIVEDMFENAWGNKDQVVVDHALDFTTVIALSVIAAAGFGHRVGWNESKPPPGHKMTFKETLEVVSEGVLLKVSLPNWAKSLTSSFRRVGVAFDELEKYMQAMIDAHKISQDKEGRHDLFSNLMDANEDSEGGIQLTDREILGNIFVFLIAGHESTAHTICFALGLLALHQDEQEKVYQEVLKTTPESGRPELQNIGSLSYINCVMNETLRMFSPAPNIPKMSAEDTTLPTTNNTGQRVAVFVPKGASVVINVAGLHYNHKYWDDPMSFDPSRFEKDWPRNAFLPFSGGVRSCPGRRFSELEFIAVIAMIVRKYKVTIKEEPEFAGETFEQRKERVLQVRRHGTLTLTPTRVPLVFTKRN